MKATEIKDGVVWKLFSTFNNIKLKYEIINFNNNSDIMYVKKKVLKVNV